MPKARSIAEFVQVLLVHAVVMAQFVEHGEPDLVTQLFLVDPAVPIHGQRQNPFAVDVHRI